MVEVAMPQMGESIVEGTVTKWLKKLGERVERDEPLFEVSTEKVDTEVPSPAGGILKEILVEEGKTVAVSTVVARIDESGAITETRTTETTAALAPEPVFTPEPPAPSLYSEVAEVPISPTIPVTPQPQFEPPSAPMMEAPPPMPTPPPKARVEPMSIMRQKIAEHMVFSKHSAPHVTSVHRVDMTHLAALRERHREEFRGRYGFSLTYLPFIVAAAARALCSFPLLNASVDGKNIVYHNEVNIGIAVALESGLIVPVIRHADDMNVIGLQRAIVELATRARTKRLKPEEVKGSTFSVTNFGVFGTVLATPVINQPNVAILGVGAVEKTPVVIEDAIAIRSICFLSLTYDHRLIDGAIADQFCQNIRSALEHWSEELS